MREATQPSSVPLRSPPALPCVRYYHPARTRPFHSARVSALLARALFVRAPRDTAHHLHRPLVWIPSPPASSRRLFWLSGYRKQPPVALSTNGTRLLIRPRPQSIPVSRLLISSTGFDASHRASDGLISPPCPMRSSRVGYRPAFTLGLLCLDGTHGAHSQRQPASRRRLQLKYLRLWLAQPMAELAFGPERV